MTLSFRFSKDEISCVRFLLFLYPFKCASHSVSRFREQRLYFVYASLLFFSERLWTAHMGPEPLPLKIYSYRRTAEQAALRYACALRLIFQLLFRPVPEDGNHFPCGGPGSLQVLLPIVAAFGLGGPGNRPFKGRDEVHGVSYQVDGLGWSHIPYQEIEAGPAAHRAGINDFL